MDHRLAGGLPVGRRTEFDVNWISMEDRLGRRLEPEFDGCCFPTRMIDWAADSDPNSMTTGFGWIIASRLRLGRRTGGIFDSVETEASAGGAVKMKAAAAGGAQGH